MVYRGSPYTTDELIARVGARFGMTGMTPGEQSDEAGLSKVTSVGRGLYDGVEMVVKLVVITRGDERIAAFVYTSAAKADNNVETLDRILESVEFLY